MFSLLDFKLIFYPPLRQTNLCFLQTCNRNTEHKNHLLKVVVKHSGSGWEHMLICTASSRRCLYTRVFLPTLLLVFMPWKYFLKCDYRNTAGVPGPCSIESQNQPARGGLDVKPWHWPDPSEMSWAPFLNQNRLTKVLTKPLCQKKKNPNPRHWNQLWNSTQITASTEAVNTGVRIWFDGTDRGTAQWSLLGECFLEELLWAPALELGGWEHVSTGTAHLNSHWQIKYACAIRPAAPSGVRAGKGRGSHGAAREQIWLMNGSQDQPPV